MLDFQSPGPGSFAAMTAPEINEIADRSGSILVVPIGAVEQHGHHLPVGTDSLLVSAIVRESVRRAVEDSDVPALALPTLWSGVSAHHLAFGGTVTGEFETLLDLLDEIAISGLDNGFDALVIVNGHAGNASLVDTAVSRVGRESDAAEVLGLTYFDLAGEVAETVRDSETGGMGHGGEFETSLMLHLYPDLVREDRTGTPLEEPYDRGISDLMAGASLSVYRPIEEYSSSGAIGNPELATAAKGEEFFAATVEELCSLLRSVTDRNYS